MKNFSPAYVIELASILEKAVLDGKLHNGFTGGEAVEAGIPKIDSTFIVGFTTAFLKEQGKLTMRQIDGQWRYFLHDVKERPVVPTAYVPRLDSPVEETPVAKPITAKEAEQLIEEGKKKAFQHTPRKTQIGGEHYINMTIQPVEYILKNELGFLEGCVVKYVSRWKAKNGVEDLKKARHCLDMLIEEASEIN